MHIKKIGRYTKFICYIYTYTTYSIIITTSNMYNTIQHFIVDSLHCSVLAFCYVLKPIWEFGLGAIMLIAIQNANKSIAFSY